MDEPPYEFLRDFELTLDAKRQHKGVVTHIWAHSTMPPHLVHGEDLKAPEFTEDTLEWVRKYWLKKPDYVFFKHPEISAVAGQCLFVGLYEMPRRKEDDACSNWSEDTDNMHCPGE